MSASSIAHGFRSRESIKERNSSGFQSGFQFARGAQDLVATRFTQRGRKFSSQSIPDASQSISYNKAIQRRITERS
jgi:hypothetical protein